VASGVNFLYRFEFCFSEIILGLFSLLPDCCGAYDANAVVLLALLVQKYKC
jgi:hypothetical protein